MNEKYLAFVKSENIDHSDLIQTYQHQNNNDLPSNIGIIVQSYDSKNSLRTSPRVINYLTRDLKNRLFINSYEDLHSKINQALLVNFKETRCFLDATVEGEFVNKLGKYTHESLNLTFKVQEKSIFSSIFSLGIEKQQLGVAFKPIFTNLFGQCENLSFKARKNFSVFDYQNRLKFNVLLQLPYATPDLCFQEYKLSCTKDKVINGLSQSMFKIKANFNHHDNYKKKISLGSQSHHFVQEIDHTNILSSPQNAQSVFDQTLQTYQNVVLKAGYSHDFKQNDKNSTFLNQVTAEVGYGSNNSLFSKIKLRNLIQEAKIITFRERQFSTIFENRFQFGFLFSFLQPISFVEKFTLFNQPSYKSINLKDKSINSSTIGSNLFSINQTKFYLNSYPLLKRLGITPFFHLFTAFVPSEEGQKLDQLNLTKFQKTQQFLSQSLRISAGIGFSYASEAIKTEFIYSFGELLSKPEKDEFSRFQFNFY